MNAPMVDAHHLGLGATGNETWAAGVVAALEVDGGDPVTYAVTAAGRSLLPSSVGDERRVVVGASSTRRLLLDLPRVVRARRPSALVVQYTLPPRLRVPGVVAVHDLSFEDPASAAWIPPRTRARYRASIRSSSRRAAAVLALTEWGRQDLLGRYDLEPARVLVASPGVDAAIVRALETTELRRPEVPVVLCVGTLLRRKNLDVAARAVAALRADGVPAVLRLVGPERDPEVVAELEAVLPGGALERWGAVGVERLAEAYRTSSVLAFPSRYEGFGLPVVEAMAAGLPVVTSTATCLPEVGGDAVLTADPDDAVAWSDALGRVVSDAGVAADLAARGGIRVAAFDWARTAAAVRAAVTLATT